MRMVRITVEAKEQRYREVALSHSATTGVGGRRGAPPRVCVVGGGTWLLGGLSYYTHRLAHALAECNDTSVILMRRLLPRPASNPGHRAPCTRSPS
jgi:hypothetical protein